MAVVGRRIVNAPPSLSDGAPGNSQDDILTQVRRLLEQLPALDAFLQTVRDSLDEGQPPGQASGASGIPEDVDGTTPAAVGTSASWSPSNHRHAADVSGTPGGVAATAAQGSGSGLARTDHSHRLTLLTAKGDLAVHNGTDPIRLPVGTNTYVLQADSAQTAGVKWSSTSALIVLTAGRFVYTDSGGLLTTNAAFLVNDSGAGNWVVSVRKSFSAEGAGPLNVVGTMPVGVPTHALFLDGTPTDGTTLPRIVEAVLRAGYTGTNPNTVFWGANQTAGTGTSIYSAGNCGADLQATATTAGTNIGVRGSAQGGNLSIGIGGVAVVSKASASNIGVLGVALNGGGTAPYCAGYFHVSSTVAPTVVDAVLISDNVGSAIPILVCRDNGSNVFVVDDGGDIKIARTVTAAGTTGARTINQAAGSVNFAAGATTLVVTNSLVVANSIVLAVLRTNDASAVLGAVVPTAGSFTINMAVAPTAETAVGFLVING